MYVYIYTYTRRYTGTNKYIGSKVYRYSEILITCIVGWALGFLAGLQLQYHWVVLHSPEAMECNSGRLFVYLQSGHCWWWHIPYKQESLCVFKQQANGWTAQHLETCLWRYYATEATELHREELWFAQERSGCPHPPNCFSTFFGRSLRRQAGRNLDEPKLSYFGNPNYAPLSSAEVLWKEYLRMTLKECRSRSLESVCISTSTLCWWGPKCESSSTVQPTHRPGQEHCRSFFLSMWVCEFAYMIYYGPTVLNYCILDEDQVRNLAYLWQVMPLGSDSCLRPHPTLRGVFHL